MKRANDKRSGFTIIELLFVIGIFCLMIIILTPFVHMAKERAHKIACANNLRHISLALHSYAADNNDAFPQSLGALYPNYVESEQVFDCPSSKLIGSAANPDYKYFTGLTETSGPKEVIAQDSKVNHKNSGGNILRVDGTVEWTREIY